MTCASCIRFEIANARSRQVGEGFGRRTDPGQPRTLDEPYR
ncbi:hypothetical protein AB0955_09940 [Streptomyces cellulosae]